MTVVCKTTRSTLKINFEPCLPALGSWPGGGGAELGTGTWATVAEAKTAAAQSTRERYRREGMRRRKDSVAGGGISGLGIDAGGRKARGGAESDRELSPTRCARPGA